jgi:hypothetical protein
MGRTDGANFRERVAGHRATSNHRDRQDAEHRPVQDQADEAITTSGAPQDQDNEVIGVYHFKTAARVIQAVVENQKGADWWPHCEDLKWLRHRSERLIHTLDLRVKDSGARIGGSGRRDREAEHR